MKNLNPFVILTTIFTTLVFAALFTLAAPLSIYLKSTGVVIGSQTKLCENTGTTTVCSAPARKVQVFDSDYQQQGGCYVFKDKSGVGYSYLSVEDGVAVFSSLSCE